MSKPRQPETDLERGDRDAILVLDEVQKAANWSESVKRITTLANYLDLLHAAGMVTGLPKYAGQTEISSRKPSIIGQASFTAAA